MARFEGLFYSARSHTRLEVSIELYKRCQPFVVNLNINLPRWQLTTSLNGTGSGEIQLLDEALSFPSSVTEVPVFPSSCNFSRDQYQQSHFLRLLLRGDLGTGGRGGFGNGDRSLCLSGTRRWTERVIWNNAEGVSVALMQIISYIFLRRLVFRAWKAFQKVASCQRYRQTERVI